MSTTEEPDEVQLGRRVNELVNAMAKPLFTYRMAKPMAVTHPNTPLTRSARTRLTNAAREIDRLVTLYVAHAEALTELAAESPLDAVD
jgi:hypothetical protein